MNIREDVINMCAYFFEVLVSSYIDLEKAIKKQSGILYLFKKIDFMDRVNAFCGLLDRALEVINQLKPFYGSNLDDYELNALIIKLEECLSLYINMVNVQMSINKMLDQKAKGCKYDWNEYSTSLNQFNMTRDALENELPQLKSLYSQVLM